MVNGIRTRHFENLPEVFNLTLPENLCYCTNVGKTFQGTQSISRPNLLLVECFNRFLHVHVGKYIYRSEWLLESDIY